MNWQMPGGPLPRLDRAVRSQRAAARFNYEPEIPQDPLEDLPASQPIYQIPVKFVGTMYHNIMGGSIGRPAGITPVEQVHRHHGGHVRRDPEHVGINRKSKAKSRSWNYACIYSFVIFLIVLTAVWLVYFTNIPDIHGDGECWDIDRLNNGHCDEDMMDDLDCGADLPDCKNHARIDTICNQVRMIALNDCNRTKAIGKLFPFCNPEKLCTEERKALLQEQVLCQYVQSIALTDCYKTDMVNSKYPQCQASKLCQREQICKKLREEAKYYNCFRAKKLQKRYPECDPPIQCIKTYTLKASTSSRTTSQPTRTTTTTTTTTTTFFTTTTTTKTITALKTSTIKSTMQTSSMTTTKTTTTPSKTTTTKSTSSKTTTKTTTTPSKTTTKFTMQTSSMTTTKMTTTPNLEQCPQEFQKWVGDGDCDDVTNIKECQFDGGDCCASRITHGACLDCLCQNGDNTVSDDQAGKMINCPTTHSKWVGDGYCDDATNVEECLFDAGDCCKANMVKGSCLDCDCKKPTLIEPQIMIDPIYSYKGK